MVGRVVTYALPPDMVHALQKHYYAYVLRNKVAGAEADQTVVGHLVSEGDSVIDIGASIGGYTRYLSDKVGPRGHVYSFEANPSTFDFLTHNVAALKLSNVTPFNSAVSDVAGTAELLIPQYRWGSECHYDARLSGPVKSNWRKVPVTTVTLDAALADRSIAFIKCDANFHELACLQGAVKLIEKSRPAMLIEVNPDPDDPTTSAYSTFALLSQYGYQAYWFDRQKMRPRLAGERSQNYFFLTPGHLASVSRFMDNSEQEMNKEGLKPQTAGA